MTGYVLACGPCIACGRPFMFNPVHVPSSTALTGLREPLCRSCMDRINAKRADMGLDPFPILPDAYEAASEEDLP